MSVKTETVSTFTTIDDIEVAVRTVDADDDNYSGEVVLEIDGCEFSLSEEDVEDLRFALNQTGF